MSNRIQNGDFSAGFNYWYNGAGGGLAYTLDSGKAKASSLAGSTSPQLYKMYQPFDKNYYGISARIWVWAQWQAASGNVSDGYNQFIVQLVKPSGSTVDLVNTTKTGVSSSGYILNNADILTHMSEYGTYKLWLLCRSVAAKDHYTGSDSVSEPYGTWTDGSSWAFTKYDSNNKIYVYREPDGPARWGSISKTFSVDYVPPDSATVTIEAKGVDYHPANDGITTARVRLYKPDDSYVTLYDAELTGNTWTNILNNADISSHITQTGTYKLVLYAYVDGDGAGDSYRQEVHFANVDLNVSWSWDEYTQSFGWFDNITLDLKIRRGKMIKEDVGCTDDPDKKTMIDAAEGINLGESFSSQVYRPKSVKEDIALSDILSMKALSEIKEDVGLVESYNIVRGVQRTEKEDIGLDEILSYFRIYTRTIKADIGMKESLTGERTSGNVITKIPIVEFPVWEDVAQPGTLWSIKKTEI